MNEFTSHAVSHGVYDAISDTYRTACSCGKTFATEDLAVAHAHAKNQQNAAEAMRQNNAMVNERGG